MVVIVLSVNVLCIMIIVCFVCLIFPFSVSSGKVKSLSLFYLVTILVSYIFLVHTLCKVWKRSTSPMSKLSDGFSGEKRNFSRFCTLQYILCLLHPQMQCPLRLMVRRYNDTLSGTFHHPLLDTLASNMTQKFRDL